MLKLNTHLELVYMCPYMQQLGIFVQGKKKTPTLLDCLFCFIFFVRVPELHAYRDSARINAGRNEES